MPLINDVFELTHVQSLQGQEVTNVYFYSADEIFVTTYPTWSQLLAENWVTQILPDVLAAQSVACFTTGVRVRDLFDPDDSFEMVVSDAGAVAVDPLATFDALSFSITGETAAVRKGAKRIAGVPDVWEASGTIIDPDGIAAGTALAEAIGRAVQVGTIIMDDVFFPVLVKRVRSGTPGNYEYRLPENSGETIKTRILNVLFEILTTSQVSRKIGVGS